MCFCARGFIILIDVRARVGVWVCGWVGGGYILIHVSSQQVRKSAFVNDDANIKQTNKGPSHHSASIPHIKVHIFGCAQAAGQLCFFTHLHGLCSVVVVISFGISVVKAAPVVVVGALTTRDHQPKKKGKSRIICQHTRSLLGTTA